MLFVANHVNCNYFNTTLKSGSLSQGWRHEFEGGGSIHWKVGVQYIKNSKIVKPWGA